MSVPLQQVVSDLQVIPSQYELGETTKSYSAKIVPLLCLPTVTDNLSSYEHSIEVGIVKKDGSEESLSEFLVHLQQRPVPGELLTTSELRAYSVHTESDYVWEITDDKGAFTSVDTAVDMKIKGARHLACLNEITTGTFTHKGSTYNVDFNSMSMMEIGSFVQRKLQANTPYWCYFQDEIGYIRHEDRDSHSIEEIYRFGGKYACMGGTEYTFCFSPSKSFQIDIHTGVAVQISRYPLLASTPSEIKIKLHIRGVPRCVAEVDQFISCFVESQTKDRLLSLQLPVDKKRQQLVINQIANITRQYCVSAVHSCSGNQIAVRMNGVPGYVDQVYSNVQTLITAELQHYVLTNSSVMSSSANVPEDWQPQTGDCELISVPKHSTEWNGVYELMKRTLPKVEIEKLERVQNQPLWEKYSLERKQMEKRNNGEVNEKLLFHGSRQTNPRDIAFSLKGVDFRLSSRTRRLMWGIGAYFAVDASYSDNYAYPLQRAYPKQLILVRVLTGISCRTNQDSTLTRPPPLPMSSPTTASTCTKHYDTVNGSTNGSMVYVVYDHDKSYPAYIITYKSEVIRIY